MDELASLDRLWEARSRALTTADAVHDTLREAIVEGHLRPGVRLSEIALAGRLSTSRTPVREALLRLESERLVERNGRGGLVVGEITREDVLELYVVRQVINGLTARLAAESASAADIEGVRWINDELRRAGMSGDFRRMAALNLQFYDALAVASRNGLVLTLLRQVHDRVRRFPGTTFSYGNRAVEAADEHEELLRAIEGRDADRAEAIARAHMARAMDVRIQMLRADFAREALGTAGAGAGGGPTTARDDMNQVTPYGARPDDRPFDLEGI